MRTLATLALLVPGLALAQGAAAPATPQKGEPAKSAAKPAKADPTATAIELLRADLRAKKEDLVARNMKLTDAEAAAFWPVYRRYQADLAKVGDARVALLQEYLKVYTDLGDADAHALTTRSFDNEARALELRRQYQAELERVLPAKRVAQFFQIERYVSLLGDVQAQSRIPFIR